jgi:hypothetical protein
MFPQSEFKSSPVAIEESFKLGHIWSKCEIYEAAAGESPSIGSSQVRFLKSNNTIVVESGKKTIRNLIQ